MNEYDAAVRLIRELDINRQLVDAHLDTECDHRALNEATERYKQAHNVPSQRGPSWPT